MSNTDKLAMGKTHAEPSKLAEAEKLLKNFYDLEYEDKKEIDGIIYDFNIPEVSELLEAQSLLSYEKGRAETIQKVENEFNVFMCSTNRCAHKERGEWKLFQDAKKQIIRRLKANHPTTDAK